ncbi:hypothetical protein COW36_02600 [bacterium (Candidatus Blackallbacteria) CG17_big_fil_post_rev_8_21_14_2_50_48_46]|uniref:Uncharacterized protein n=1 Tax=bacterium (Candidatus Blackallbacteria) CG17_big_fil_post_rev_8_21_14_2_50_48_46 TaxID=2014261 RepID=A0A2M7GA45_9BACT|nr:MAG: hypothetical protein COW64_12870 [bacterium (Candidatus Blackallbacteria) CG18_big_fil_WC_8_21_14_2_50_49_26]PIW19018.1 MAG: hypothetical protein COW36_02600 [bacterium (Candidatus Blackallbacteria) CG17_big_fil_post_rev_8_21_14_2_50_48_46]PIW44614.1 MAG: hypothetical protein COW20_23515 [bacterium (Candidatus Blackallbacteria) CG13_big_fil_rev_8_21_14_2_50_49_14]
MVGQVIGKGSVWFYRPLAEYPEVFQPQKPLSWSHGGKAIEVYQMPDHPFVPPDPTAAYLNEANLFDLKAWKPLQGRFEQLFFSAEAGILKRRK